MKTTLEFNEEEQMDLLYALHGFDFLMVLSGINDYLTDKQENEGKESVGVDDLRDYIKWQMYGRNLSFNMLL